MRIKFSPGGGDALDVKILSLRRADVCARCASPLAAGARAAWVPESRQVFCLSCSAGGTDVSQQLEPEELEARPTPVRVAVAPAAVAAGEGAGNSALREFQRRSAKREESIRSRHPKLGGLILALSNEPTSTRVWAQGAAGERAVAATLNELAGDHLIALHDRRMLRPDGRASRANIDHLVIAASGVWVIDAKTHRGTLEVRRSGGLFSPRVERLYIGGRDKSSLLEGLRAQVAAVRTVLAEVGAEIPVRGALCFVGTELPWFGDSIDGVPLVGRRGLGKLLRKPGDLTAEDRDALAQFLAARFVPA